MGLRTEHQQDAKAQLIVEIARTDLGKQTEGSLAALLDAAGGEDSGLVIADDTPSARDILENIRLVDGAGQKINPLPFPPSSPPTHL